MRTFHTSTRGRWASSSMILTIGIVLAGVCLVHPSYAQDDFFDEEENDARTSETPAEETVDAPPQTKEDLEAGDARRVEQLGALGRKHYQKGDYEKAINAYWKAYLIFDDAVVLYNIGRSYEKLGDLERAKESYKRCLGYESLDMEVRIRIEARLKSVEYELQLLEPVVQEPPPPPERPKPVVQPPPAQKPAPSKAVQKAAQTSPSPSYDDQPPTARPQQDAADNDIWTSMAPVSLAAGAFALTAVTLVGALVAGLLIYRGVSAHQQVEDAKLQTDLNGTSPLTQREAAALIESGTVDKAWGITAAGASGFVFVLGSALGVSAIATAYITASE